MPNTTKRSPRNTSDARRLSDRNESRIPSVETLKAYFDRHALFCGMTRLQAELEAEHLAKYLKAAAVMKGGA